jgi:class 3 adenylate cyclase
MPLDTGDGIALVFFDTPTAPVACAVELSRKLRMLPQLRLRMGIHFGPA